MMAEILLLPLSFKTVRSMDSSHFKNQDNQDNHENDDA
jgi:hypothetical protein